MGLEGSAPQQCRPAHGLDVDRSGQVLGAHEAQSPAGFRSFLGWLYKRQEIDELPSDFPWPRVPEHAPRILSIEAQAKILASIPPERRGIFLAMALMGLRPLEAVALRAADYHDGWLTVSRAREDRTLDARELGTKSGKIKRLPVPDPVKHWISSFVPRERRLTDGYLFEVPYSGRGRHPRGPWSETGLRRTWYEACDRAGVPRTSLHEGTKHTFATDAIARGVSERALQTYLGHADAKSARRYAKLSDQALIDMIERPKVVAAWLQGLEGVSKLAEKQGEIGGPGRKVFEPPGRCHSRWRSSRPRSRRPTSRSLGKPCSFGSLE
ncbi:MAG: site-specific integrase [Myxococcota bacterium]|nr:site-specific integrase [Myxococcota bacterium]